jgi:VanZ family protein
LRYQLPAIAWFVVTVAVSSIPSNSLSISPIFNRDKLLHMGEFTILAFLAYRAFRYQARFPALAARPVFYATLFSSMYGPIDEAHQLFTPGRSFDPFDMIADALGALLFAALYLAIASFRKRRGVPGDTR